METTGNWETATGTDRTLAAGLRAARSAFFLTEPAADNGRVQIGDGSLTSGRAPFDTVFLLLEDSEANPN